MLCRVSKFLGAVAIAFAFMSFSGYAGYAQAANKQIIENVKSNGTLRVGMAEHVPAQFKDPVTGKWRGFNVDLATDLATVLKVKLEIVSSTWSSLVPGLQAGKYDIIMSDLYATPPRALVVNFTDNYMEQSNALAVRGDLGVSELAGLNDPSITFATISGTASSKSVDTNFPNAKKKEFVSDNEFAHLLELAAKRVDAVLYERTTVERFLRSNPGSKIKILPDVRLDVQGVSYALPRGDQDSLNFMNVWIAYVQRQGVIDKLRNKWFIDYLASK